MRYFKIEKGGYCREEKHPWEHEVLDGAEDKILKEFKPDSLLKGDE